MGSFPKFRLKKSKLSILTENWHTWYLEGADSKSRLWFLKLRPQNPFFGEFGPKKSKLFFLPENWHIWYLEDGDSCCEFPTLNPVLGKSGPKESKLSVLPANWHTWYLGDADSYPNISFLNLQPKIYFWANLDQKSQSCLFRLKIGTHGIFRMLILVPTLVLWISKSKSIFGKNLGQKSQSYPFLAKIGTQSILRVLILIPTSVFSISNPEFIFGQIWTEKSKSFTLLENWHTDYLEDADSYCEFSEFPNPKSIFSQFEKTKALCFQWKLEHTHTHTHTHMHTHTHSPRILILISETLFFSNFNPKYLGYWFLFWFVFWNSKPKPIF